MLKSSLLVASLVLSGLTVTAQNTTPASSTTITKTTKQKKELSPEDRAVRVLRMMTSKAQLTDAQSADVKQILLDREKSIANARNTLQGKERKAAIDVARNKADSKLQTILSPEQWKSWVTFKEEQKKRHQEKKGAPKSTTTPTAPSDQEDFY
jgi:Spy/CpxP family protein refolding chaperone